MEQTDRETLRPRAAKKEQKHSERRQLGQVHPAVQGGSGQSLGWLDAQALKAQPCLSAEPPCLNSVDGDEFCAPRRDGTTASRSGSIPLGCMRSLASAQIRVVFGMRVVTLAAGILNVREVAVKRVLPIAVTELASRRTNFQCIEVFYSCLNTCSC